MDVRCGRCGTEFELDDERVQATGLSVQCSQCGFVFRVFREEADHDVWKVRQEDGNVFQFRELTTLQRWIVERKVSRDDEISKTAKHWKRLGDIPELAPFFEVVDAADKGGSVLPTFQPSVDPLPTDGVGAELLSLSTRSTSVVTEMPSASFNPHGLNLQRTLTPIIVDGRVVNAEAMEQASAQFGQPETLAPAPEAVDSAQGAGGDPMAVLNEPTEEENAESLNELPSYAGEAAKNIEQEVPVAEPGDLSEHQAGTVIDGAHAVDAAGVSTEANAEAPQPDAVAAVLTEPASSENAAVSEDASHSAEAEASAKPEFTGPPPPAEASATEEATAVPQMERTVESEGSMPTIIESDPPSFEGEDDDDAGEAFFAASEEVDAIEEQAVTQNADAPVDNFDDDDFDDDDLEFRPKRRWPLWVATLAILGGGGWYIIDQFILVEPGAADASAEPIAQNEPGSEDEGAEPSGEDTAGTSGEGEGKAPAPEQGASEDAVPGGADVDAEAKADAEKTAEPEAGAAKTAKADAPSAPGKRARGHSRSDLRKKNRTVLMRDGKNFLKKGQVQTAKRHFLEILSRDSKDVDAMYWDARCLIDQAEPRAAIAVLNKARGLRGNWAPLYEGLGMAYQQLGQKDQAREYYDTFLRLQPQGPEATRVRRLRGQL